MEPALLWAVAKVKVLRKCRCLGKGYVQYRSQVIGTEKQGSAEVTGPIPVSSFLKPLIYWGCSIV